MEKRRYRKVSHRVRGNARRPFRHACRIQKLANSAAVHIPLAAAGCLAGAAAIATNTVGLKGCDLICGEYDGQSSTLCDMLSAMLTAAVSCAASIVNPFSALVGDTAAFITAEGFTHFASDFLGFDVTQYCNLFSH